MDNFRKKSNYRIDIFFLILITIFIISCAAQQKVQKRGNDRPKWLENPKSVYSEQQYLTAIGEADSHQEAQNIAAANLSKIFKMEVKADETTIQRAMELTTSEGTISEENFQVTKNVNVISGQTLMNVEYAESYTDNLGRTFVLAYLNRHKTAMIYEEKIEGSSEKISHYISKGKSEQDHIKVYAFYNAALIIAKSNEVLLDQLDVISPMDKEMIELPYNYNELESLVSEKAKNVTFGINIKNDEEGKIKIMLEEILTDYGFVTSHSPLLKIQGNVELEKTDLNREDGFKFMRYNLQIMISDNNSNIVAAFSKKGREGHTNFIEAKARIYRIIEKKIGKTLKRKINNYIDKLVKS